MKDKLTIDTSDVTEMLADVSRLNETLSSVKDEIEAINEASKELANNNKLECKIFDKDYLFKEGYGASFASQT